MNRNRRQTYLGRVNIILPSLGLNAMKLHNHQTISDKSDAFGFHIAYFPFMSSSIPFAPAYEVYATLHIRYARFCSYYRDFLSPHRAPVTRLLS